MGFRSGIPAVLALVLPALAGCGDEKVAQSGTAVRPVKSVVVQHGPAGEAVSLTGQVQAQNQANLAFRAGGRLAQRTVSLGDRVTAGQVVARLESQDARNLLRQAQASFATAQTALETARNAFNRQEQLLAQGVTTRANFEAAQQQMQAAQGQFEATQAQLQNARDNVGYSELIADQAGVVTAVGAEPGEVVAAGKMVVQVAQQGGLDAVFNVPLQLMRSAPPDPVVRVSLPDDPAVMALGRVREASPQADPVTGTYLVKVALDRPPPAMFLGATVVGSVSIGDEPVVRVPGTALLELGGKPAVWVVDPASSQVALREVAVMRYDPSAVIVSDGLKDGEIVVAAGVHALRAGQKVRLLDPPAQGKPGPGQ